MLLRLPTLADEAIVRTAHAEMAPDGFAFALMDYDPDGDFGAWVEQCRGAPTGTGLPDGYVRSAFLLAEVAGQVVGRTSLRFELNDFLTRVGGHVGYGVRPEFRRRGYATEILRLSIEQLRAEGVADILITCDDGNIGSARTIESCGGQLESIVDQASGVPKRRYRVGRSSPAPQA